MIFPCAMEMENIGRKDLTSIQIFESQFIHKSWDFQYTILLHRKNVTKRRKSEISKLLGTKTGMRKTRGEDYRSQN